MSRELVENIHYMFAQTSKSFNAYDIIDNGKDISVLVGDDKGNLKTFWINKKYQAKFRKLLSEALDINKKLSLKNYVNH